jgi:L-alanine-DL-glutamate epimerase-like enolase superfamily enzyme
MKIVQIKPVPLQFPFTDRAQGHAWRGQHYSRLEALLVRVETSDGFVGWGEAFSYNCQGAVCAAITEMVAPLAVGRDSRHITALLFDLQKTLHIYGRYGILNFALSGLDIALWDIAAKRAGRPLSELLGGAKDTLVETYASLFRYHDPQRVAEQVRGALAAGFRSIKIHERTDSEAQAARAAAGPDVPLMMDTNCSWSPIEALNLAHRLKQYNLRWLEEPVFPPEDFGALAALQAATGVPIAAGENACTAFEFHKMIQARAVAYVQPSVTKVGGITEFRKICALAEVNGVALAPHSPYFGPGLLATLHLVATQPLPMPVEYFCIDLEAKPYGSRLDPEHGVIVLPTDSGLGCEPDPGVLNDYRVR